MLNFISYHDDRKQAQYHTVGWAVKDLFGGVRRRCQVSGVGKG